MKLTNKDITILKEMGYKDQELKQIEKATSKRYTKYEINDKKATLEEVLKIMDREEYLDGIARSAFHWNSVRDGKNGEQIYFDSSKLFNKNN